MDILGLRKFDTLSPFEIKDELIKLGQTHSQTAHTVFLNAGRGNPNWVATKPRDAFFLLGQFAMSESRRVMDDPVGLGGMAVGDGIAGRLDAWLAKHKEMPGADTLAAIIPFAIEKFGFEPDSLVHELVDSIIGDNYPVPDRSLRHNERITHEYLMWAMCSGQPPAGRFDLFPVEGGTAAMCYIFKSLKANRLLKAGDTIALATPIFTPYLEMPHLEDYGLNVIYVNAEQEDRFQYTAEDLSALEDAKVKAFFLVNPGNPSAVAVSSETITRLVELVTTKRPDLMVLTDDVYGTFVKGFRSLMADLPRNTIGVYSYSKYFGCTGWRLGVIALHEDNVYDKAIAALPEAEQKALDERYHTLTLEPRKVKFIDRLVADSRDVALNHTAGLSLPQQVMMSLFSLVELIDTKKAYQDACMAIVKKRLEILVEGLGIEFKAGPLFDAYYGIIDFEFWLRKYAGEDVVQYVKKNVHPLDIVFKLAEDHGIVLLNGGGFHAPDWSARVSFANLQDNVYGDIGRAVRSIARGYVQAYRAAQGQQPTT